MSRGRGGRHNQLPGDDLVAIAVVGERADHGGSPAFSGVWHTHIVLGSARGGQEAVRAGSRVMAFGITHQHARFPIDSAAWVADFQIRDRSPRSQFRYAKKAGERELSGLRFPRGAAPGLPTSTAR